MKSSCDGGVEWIGVVEIESVKSSCDGGVEGSGVV